MDSNAKRQAARIVARLPVWEVALHVPTVRVRVEAESRGQAVERAIALTPDEYAEALVRRLQCTRPRSGDVVGAHEITLGQPAPTGA